jgi:2-polyprenyl-6-methoxyphenol hydroxylase-like FAD-dependent oxidoreductase
MSTPTATVVGGNFAGLATGIGLLRAGIPANVYERQTLAGLQGAKGGIHLWPNALQALRVLDAADHVMDVSVEWQSAAMVTTSGRVMNEWPLHELKRELGLPVVLIQRRDLVRALAERLAELDPDALRTGMTFASLQSDDAGVTARFESGETVRADMLIGADGQKSKVRAEVFGPWDLRPGGGPMIRGEALIDGGSQMPERSLRVYYGHGYQMGLNRIDEHLFSWFLRTPTGTELPLDVEALGAVVRGWAEPIEAVIAATPPEELKRVVLRDSDPPERWGDGRVSFAGDAAHPMLNSLSQGAAQALEDAAVLHLEAARDSQDVPALLRRFEARRLPRARDYVKRSRRMGDMGVWRNPVACAARSAIMRTAGPMVWKQLVATTRAGMEAMPARETAPH